MPALNWDVSGARGGRYQFCRVHLELCWALLGIFTARDVGEARAARAWPDVIADMRCTCALIPSQDLFRFITTAKSILFDNDNYYM